MNAPGDSPIQQAHDEEGLLLELHVFPDKDSWIRSDEEDGGRAVFGSAPSPLLPIEEQNNTLTIMTTNQTTLSKAVGVLDYLSFFRGELKNSSMRWHGNKI